MPANTHHRSSSFHAPSLPNTQIGFVPHRAPSPRPLLPKLASFLPSPRPLLPKIGFVPHRAPSPGPRPPTEHPHRALRSNKVMDPVIELDSLEVRFGPRAILKNLKATL